MLGGLWHGGSALRLGGRDDGSSASSLVRRRTNPGRGSLFIASSSSSLKPRNWRVAAASASLVSICAHLSVAFAWTSSWSPQKLVVSAKQRAGLD